MHINIVTHTDNLLHIQFCLHTSTGARIRIAVNVIDNGIVNSSSNPISYMYVILQRSSKNDPDQNSQSNILMKVNVFRLLGGALIETVIFVTNRIGDPNCNHSPG